MCMYVCVYMYDVLVETIGRGGRREGLKAGDKQEGELTSLASDRIWWDWYVYKLAHLSLGFVWI